MIVGMVTARDDRAALSKGMLAMSRIIVDDALVIIS